MTRSFLFLSVIILSACSSPKYTYHFDHFDYNAGKTATPKAMIEASPSGNSLALQRDEVVASVSSSPAVSSRRSLSGSLIKKVEHYSTLSKAERKAVKREVKQEIRKYTKEYKANFVGGNTKATKELDDELKLAIIFGAVGITLTILGGISFIFWVLGVAGLAVGLVFFIRWISRQ